MGKLQMRKDNNKQFITNNDLVEYLYRNNYFNTLSKSLKINDYDKDDLISICIEYLLKMDTNKLIDLYDRDVLLPYLNKMLFQQWYSNKSEFYNEIIKFNLLSDELGIECEDDNIN
jgi:hypothetical protein